MSASESSTPRGGGGRSGMRIKSAAQGEVPFEALKVRSFKLAIANDSHVFVGSAVSGILSMSIASAVDVEAIRISISGREKTYIHHLHQHHASAGKQEGDEKGQQRHRRRHKREETYSTTKRLSSIAVGGDDDDGNAAAADGNVTSMEGSCATFFKKVIAVCGVPENKAMRTPPPSVSPRDPRGAAVVSFSGAKGSKGSETTSPPPPRSLALKPTVTVPLGEYQIPFRFDLPQQLPPSVSFIPTRVRGGETTLQRRGAAATGDEDGDDDVDEGCSIVYEVKAFVDIRGCKRTEDRCFLRMHTSMPDDQFQSRMSTGLPRPVKLELVRGCFGCVPRGVVTVGAHVDKNTLWMMREPRQPQQKQRRSGGGGGGRGDAVVSFDDNANIESPANVSPATPSVSLATTNKSVSECSSSNNQLAKASKKSPRVGENRANNSSDERAPAASDDINNEMLQLRVGIDNSKGEDPIESLTVSLCNEVSFWSLDRKHVRRVVRVPLKQEVLESQKASGKSAKGFPASSRMLLGSVSCNVKPHKAATVTVELPITLSTRRSLKHCGPSSFTGYLMSSTWFLTVHVSTASSAALGPNGEIDEEEDTSSSIAFPVVIAEHVDTSSDGVLQPLMWASCNYAVLSGDGDVEESQYAVPTELSKYAKGVQYLPLAKWL